MSEVGIPTQFSIVVGHQASTRCLHNPAAVSSDLHRITSNSIGLCDRLRSPLRSCLNI